LRDGAATLAVTLAFAVGGCGGSAKAEAPAGSGGSAQSRVGGTNSGGAAGSGSGMSGGGTRTITEDPVHCQTSDGADGIVTDTFPLPPIDPVCQPFDQPGALDATCPSGPVVECGFDDCVDQSTLTGCCRPDGRCGLWDDGAFAPGKSLGCIDRTEWVENAFWLQGDGAVSCTPQ